MSGSQEAQRPHDGPQMEAEKLRALANDVCNGMLRLFSALRTYPPGHQMILDFQARLFERLGQIIEGNGELRLEVRPRSFCIDGVDVFRDGTDPLCRRLFSEGVNALRFIEGVTREELDGFARIWHQVRAGDLPPDHSFATLFWEAALKGIEVGFVDTFTEGADAEREEKGKKKSREEEVMAVASLLKAQALPGGGGAADKTITVARSALVSLLQLESIAGLTAQDLEQLDSAQRAPPALLSEAERQALGVEIEAARREAPRRALCDLWFASAYASAQERERVLGVARQLIGLLVREGEHGPLAGALKEIGSAVRADPSRGEEFKGWIAAFLEPEQLQSASAQLDDPLRAGAALELLWLIPKSELGGLVAMLATLKTHEGRTRLIDLLVARGITGAQLVGKVADFDASLSPYLLTLRQKLPDDGSAWFVAAQLNSAQPAARREGLGQLRVGDVPRHRDRLLELLGDVDLGVRLAVYRLLTAAGERGATPQLIRHLTLGSPDDNEREQLVRALGRLGGSNAAEALRNEFGRARSEELQALCAEMLGGLCDPKAVALLEPLAGKWFAPKRLKAACRAALDSIRAAQAVSKQGGER